MSRRSVKDAVEGVQRRYLERVARPWPLIRVAGWSVVFLWVLGVLTTTIPYEPAVAYQERVDPDRTTCVPIGRGSPDGFREPLPEKNEDEYRIVWVGDSSLAGALDAKDPAPELSYIPELAIDYATGPENKRVRIFMYLLSAGRIYDKYLCVLHGLQQKPDLVVLTLNPVWLRCDQAISFWSNLYPDSVRCLPAHPIDLGLFAALCSPAQAAEGCLAPMLPGLGTRYVSLRAALRMLRNRAVGQNPERASRGIDDPFDQWVRQPFEFWFTQGRPYQGAIDPKSLQRGILLKCFDASSDTLSTVIAGRMLRALVESEIPAFVYLAPLSPDLVDDPELRSQMDALGQTMSELARRASNTQVRVWTTDLSHGMTNAQFRDFIHLSQASVFGEKLAQKLSPFLPEDTDE